MEQIEFKDMELTIRLDKPINSLIGPTNTDRKKFLNKLTNREDNRDVYIDNISIKEYDLEFLKNNIIAVFNDEEYKCEYVIQELGYYLQILNYTIEEVDLRIEEFIKIFKLKNIINKRIDSLKVNERILIKILSFLIIKPRIIAIDNLFLYLKKSEIKEILKYIKEKNICLINSTTDTEFILMSDFTYVLNDKKCILEGCRNEILSDNNILPFMGLNLPFLVELSQNLILYGLIDQNYYNKRKLADKLWK